MCEPKNPNKKSLRMNLTYSLRMKLLLSRVPDPKTAKFLLQEFLKPFHPTENEPVENSIHNYVSHRAIFKYEIRPTIFQSLFLN